MINLTGMANAPYPAARGGLAKGESKKAGVDVSNPIFGIGILMLVTVFPYMYTTFYVDVRKYWSLGAHLEFVSVLLLINLSLYVVYSGYLRAVKANYQPVRYTADFAELLLFVCRAAVIISVVANLGVVAYVIPHYAGDLGSMKEAFGDLGGVNILTQLHLCFLGPFIGISIRFKRPWKIIVTVLSVSLLARSILLSERIALIEMAIPLVVILTLYRCIRIRWWQIGLILVMVPVFFISAELLRSFSAKFVDEGGGWGMIDPWFALGWNLDRLFIYYIDVINKFYYVFDTNLHGISHHWNRGIASILSNFDLMENPKKVGFSVLETILDANAVRTPEMTNWGGFTQLFTDFGMWGILVYLGLVILFFVTHAGAVRGSMLCLGIYPLLYINFADMARLLIIYESRADFPLFTFLVAYAGCHVLSAAVPLLPHSNRLPTLRT
jgi:hypothetical protein